MSFTEYLGQRFIFPRPQAFGRLRLVQKPLDKAMAQQGPRGSTFTAATRWGQNGSSCTSTLLWLPCPRLGLLDQLHSWAQVVKR